MSSEFGEHESYWNFLVIFPAKTCQSLFHRRRRRHTLCCIRRVRSLLLNSEENFISVVCCFSPLTIPLGILFGRRSLWCVRKLMWRWWYFRQDEAEEEKKQHRDDLLYTFQISQISDIATFSLQRPRCFSRTSFILLRTNLTTTTTPWTDEAKQARKQIANLNISFSLLLFC